MTRRVRIVIGIFILVASLTLMIWSLVPMRREIRTQPIAPSDLQLPTPSSLLTQPIPVS